MYTHNLTNGHFLSDIVSNSKYIFVFDNTPWLESLSNNLNYSREYIKDKNRNGFYDLDIDISVKITYEQTSAHEKVLAFFTILMSFLTIIFVGSLCYYFWRVKDYKAKETLEIQRRLNQPEKVRKSKYLTEPASMEEVKEDNTQSLLEKKKNEDK